MCTKHKASDNCEVHRLTPQMYGLVLCYPSGPWISKWLLYVWKICGPLIYDNTTNEVVVTNEVLGLQIYNGILGKMH